MVRNEGPPDEDLLEQFLGGAESESEHAFRTLVARHGRMVRTICRRVLDRAEDAEDAFQATFLVLVRRGASIRDRTALVGWLHEVAYRVAVKVRARILRRRAVERRGAALSPDRIEPDNQGQEATWNELRPIVQEEVFRLPEEYRLPVVLGYLEGKTNEEVAALLRWPVGTVKGRLARARRLLHSRLKRRGVALSAAMLVTALTSRRIRAGVVPEGLVSWAGPHAGASRPEGVPTSSPDLVAPPWARSPAGAGRLIPRSPRLILGLLGVLILIAGLFLGVYWAAVPALWASDPGSQFSGLIPSQDGHSGSCH